MDSGEPERPEPADDASRPPAPEPLPAPPPVPPEVLKPRYYQGWFLVPAFVCWPCSAILFIRSPWHNGVVSGALSWAWIIIGGGWIFLRTQLRIQNGDPLLDPTLLALAAPGIALTAITQTLWLTRDRPHIRRIRDAGGFAAYENNADAEAPARAVNPPTPPERRRRSDRGSVRSRRRRR